MKEIYMEVVQEDGLLPENFNLAEYKHKKDLENEEWEKHSKSTSSSEISDTKHTDTTGDTA